VGNFRLDHLSRENRGMRQIRNAINATCWVCLRWSTIPSHYTLPETSAITRLCLCGHVDLSDAVAVITACCQLKTLRWINHRFGNQWTQLLLVDNLSASPIQYNLHHLFVGGDPVFALLREFTAPNLHAYASISSRRKAYGR
jgi:hypothetical protein